VAAPVVVPAQALGLAETVAPSNRITMGFIGCGGRMRRVSAAFRGVDEVQPVATCDVRQTTAEALGRKLRLKPESCYTDFRALVARDDIDTVAIATPDHWHVLQALAAMRAGKDVYCEKPLSNTIEEGRALVNTANRYGAVFQHGTQLRSTGAVRLACELVRNERIGKLKEVRIGSPPGKASGPRSGEPVPAKIDYGLWLGPAPEVPYVGQVVNSIEFQYANGVKVIMTDTGKNRHGVKFIGEKGWVFVRSKIEAEPKSLLSEKIGPEEIHLYQSPGHAQNFIDSVKSRKETIAPPEIAHRATSTALLGGIACQLNRPLHWNPDAERFADDPQADRLLSYAMRQPWHP